MSGNHHLANLFSLLCLLLYFPSMSYFRLIVLSNSICPGDLPTNISLLAVYPGFTDRIFKEILFSRDIIYVQSWGETVPQNPLTPHIAPPPHPYPSSLHHIHPALEIQFCSRGCRGLALRITKRKRKGKWPPLLYPIPIPNFKSLLETPSFSSWDFNTPQCGAAGR